MRTYLRRLIPAAAALALAAAASEAAAAECACGAATCAEVLVDSDNQVDLDCAPALLGQHLPDSDGDGIPDRCDACPCVPNPIDPDSGRAAECPTPPVADASASGGTPPVGGTPPPVLERIRCVDGSVIGMPERATIWRWRPQTFAFTRFEPNSTELAAGAELIVLRSLGAERCTTLDVGGVPSIRIVPSPWHWRAAAFASAALRVSEVGVDATTGLSGGIDHQFSASAWTLGGTLHAMTLLGSADPTPFLLGLGPRVGLFDVLALTPFVQLDALNDFRASYGLWINFDLGVLADLGLEVERLASLLR
jgi:hypothetical protein